jgi:thioesterase domain-containing protein
VIGGPDDERTWLVEVLTGRIPLGRAMELDVTRLDRDGVELRAPLAPNVNDKGTAFGGSLVSLMILAGWSLPRLLLRRHALEAELVIGRCEVRFAVPVRGDFVAVCDWPSNDATERFVESLRVGRRGRVDLAPRILAGSDVAAELSARYAALPGNLAT